MGDQTLNQKRGAPGDKGGYNPINTRKPEEYICLVGGVSNTFNGYIYLDPVPWVDVAMPHPKNRLGVPKYLKGFPPDKLAHTHDLYWANFIDPAVRLFANKVATPQPGDVVTLLIHFSDYVLRNKIDWNASPYNLILHRNSPWLATKSPSPAPKSPGSGGTAVAVATADPEHVIDHEILMRTTSDNERDRNIIKRPTNNDVYLQYIHDIPRRIVFGPMLSGKAQISDVLVKILLFEDPVQVTEYMANGAWTGEQWIHMFDKRTEEDMGGSDWPEANYDWMLASTKKLKWPKWLKPPTVDRKKIKIRRFDYIGHSAYDEFYLSYGTTNDKGVVPGAETMLNTATLRSAVKPDAFTKDAFAQLWGCFLATTMAPNLTTLFKSIVACKNRTNFERILDNDTNMPVPTAGASWDTFRRK